jgi:hypothetical protein
MAKTKLPKSVAGLKVPKRLRKSRAVRGFLDNPIGREIIAAAIVAGAGAAASALGKRRPSVRQVGEAGEAALDGSEYGRSD